MAVLVLGPVVVEGDGGLSPQHRAVLGALAVERGRSVRADQLADALWGERPPSTWPKQIQTCVVRLRKALGPAAIETTDRGYRLMLSGEDLDVDRFEGLVARARDLAATGEVDRAASTFTRALALWRGAPFAEFDSWPPAVSEAARLDELRLSIEEELLDARLESGEHREVAVAAEPLVAVEPLRERRWAILALAQYRCGRQADALRTLQHARRTLVEQLGIDPGRELVELDSAILNQDESLDHHGVPVPVSDDCPYRGLEAYDVDDRDSFFGRDTQVAACLDRLRTTRVLVVTGPSGCGKSSLVRAGLAPALARPDRPVAIVVPGNDPLETVTEAQARGERVVVIVDQLEELFAVGVDHDVARAFCASIAEQATPDTPVVLAIRADHLTVLATDPDLGPIAERGMHFVTPLTGDELRAAIEGPAHQAGLRVEHGLVDLLVRDAEGEPGALPLLSHALVETWRRRDGRVLTVEGYRASGGIRGAVARSADRLYDSLPAEQRPLLRSLMLRLVTPSLEGDPVRCRVPARALLADAARERIVAALVQARLVTTEQDTVELAHEALARAWPRLRSWLDDDAAGQRILRHLAAAADGWESLGRPDSELYRGARLEAAVEWQAASSPDLTDQETAFLAASIAEAHNEREQLAERARHQARQNRRLRRALAGVAVLLVAAIVGGLLALQQRQTARREARAAALTALTSNAAALRTNRRDLAALLAVEAHRLAPSSASESALFGTFTASPGAVRTVHTNLELGTRAGPGEYLPGDDTLALIDWRGAVHLVDLGTGDVDSLEAISDEDGFGPAIDVASDGKSLAALWRPLSCNAAWECYSLLTVWDLATRERRFDPVRVPFPSSEVAINDDGSLVAVEGGWSGFTAIYDGATGGLIHSLPPVPRPEIYADFTSEQIVFHPDGRLLVSSLAGPIRLVDPRSGVELQRIDAPPYTGDFSMHLSNGGETLITTGSTTDPTVGYPNTDMTMMVFDLESGEALNPRPHQLRARCNSFAHLERIATLLCVEPFGGLSAFDDATGVEIKQRYDPQGGYCDVIVSADGTKFAAIEGCLSSTLRVTEWRIDGGGAVSRLVAEVPTPPYGRAVTHFGFAGDDTALVAEFAPEGGEAGVTQVIDTTRGEIIDRLPGIYGMIQGDIDETALGILDDHQSAVTVGLYDIDRHTAAGPQIDPGFDIWTLERHGDRGILWGSDSDDGEFHLRGVDLDTGRLIGPTIDSGGEFQINQVAIARDVLYAAVFNFPEDRGWLERRDLETGDLLGEPLLDWGVAATGGGVVVATTQDGLLYQVDPVTFEPIGQRFPTPQAGVPTLSEDGRRLLMMGQDGTLRIYDVATRTQLGDAIEVDHLANESNAVMRPDGLAVAGITRQGIVVWDLNPDHWITAACNIAGRNLTHPEWDQYIGDLAPYRQTCPRHAAA